MANVTIKIPKRLHRVEIIRAKDIEKIPSSAYDSLDSGVELQENEVFGNIPPNDSKTLFFQEFSFADTDKPIDITKLKIPEETLPVSEVHKAVQDAYNHGFEDGEQLARNTIENEIQKQQEWVRRIDSVIENLQSDYYKQIANLEDSVVSLAIMVAEHIMKKEISSDGSIVVEQIKKAIESLDNDILFKIHINPEDFKTVVEAKSTLTTDTSRMDKVLLAIDEAVDPGGCILETSTGLIDARIKTQLEKIHNSLNNVPRTSEENIYDYYDTNEAIIKNDK